MTGILPYIPWKLNRSGLAEMNFKISFWLLKFPMMYLLNYLKMADIQVGLNTKHNQPTT
jgi:hypothetical protein